MVEQGFKAKTRLNPAFAINKIQSLSLRNEPFIEEICISSDKVSARVELYTKWRYLPKGVIPQGTREVTYEG